MFQQQQRVIIPIIKPAKRTVDHVVPGIFPGLLAAFQIILWIAILALESVSVYYDAGRGTIYAGFWCSIVFFITWVSMLSYLCCGKSSGCGTFLILQNIINLIFAIILIVFTSLFINNPCLCYNILCKIPSWDSFTDYSNYTNFPFLYANCTPRTFRKLPVLKGLLSCAVLMLVSNIIFIIVYIITYIWSRSKPVQVPSYQPSPMINPSNQYQIPYLPQPASEAHYYSPTTEPISSAPPFEMRVERF